MDFKNNHKMCTFKRVIKSTVLKEWRNVQFYKSDQMSNFKRVIKFALLKE